MTCPTCAHDLLIPNRPGSEGIIGRSEFGQSKTNALPRLVSTAKDLDFWSEEEWNAHVAKLDKPAPRRKPAFEKLREVLGSKFWIVFLGPPLLLILSATLISNQLTHTLGQGLFALTLLCAVVGAVWSGFMLAKTHDLSQFGAAFAGLGYSLAFLIVFPFVWVFTGCVASFAGAVVINSIGGLLSR